jgi:hypothetical protein
MLIYLKLSNEYIIPITFLQSIILINSESDEEFVSTSAVDFPIHLHKRHPSIILFLLIIRRGNFYNNQPRALTLKI